MSQNSDEEHEHAVILLYNSGHVIGVILQTFVYGIYAVLIPVSSYIMLRRGLATRARKILFGMTIFMFLLSTANWIASISTLIQLLQAWFLAPDPDSRSVPTYLPFFSALILVNYILTDGVVVWRAWVLCSVDGTKSLMMCFFMLGLATVSVCTTIVIRIILLIDRRRSPELNSRLTQGIDVTQVATLVLSLATNSLATFLISLKAWRNRTEIQDKLDSTVDRRSKAGKIFALLIETGIIYSISCLTVLMSTLIPLKEGTLGDLYTPVNTQLAGIYPIVVLVLVTQNHTLDRTVRAFASGIEQTHDHYSGQLETIRFQRQSSTTDTMLLSGNQSSEGTYWNSQKQGDQNGLPPIPSSNITWGEISLRENA
ncbi:uncharacterized protein C8R40DRAFT_234503 [Lentinula edodes]|uniref:uncharacterized protein n=1 Tax=Lentinula edodes TaxID=5353 RepID=UPI001E8DF239|nr:uncharacterized protein C8R40DRAFT_234503 [Lentinula edodes]KAH7874894.1 hypothetical protein C8R40DRAFT_234503 [Lentinula edodes]